MTRSKGLVLVAGFMLAACSSSGSGAPTPRISSGPGMATASPVELTIYGAASLKGALDALKAAYEATDGATTLVISTDSSAALATKIEQGAPADVFLSADTVNPGQLVDGGFAAGPPTVFAANELTIIVPSDNPAAITSPIDLATKGVQIIGAGEAVPITGYAKQLLQNLAKLPGYPADYPARCAGNVVSEEESVRAVVAKIELGQGDAAIVYATDAAASREVGTIAVPESANVRASYAAVVVKASRNQHAASAFLAWLAGPAGQAVLQRFGFLPPTP